jgi:hypothetical protein
VCWCLDANRGYLCIECLSFLPCLALLLSLLNMPLESVHGFESVHSLEEPHLQACYSCMSRAGTLATFAVSCCAVLGVCTVLLVLLQDSISPAALL